jgi:hypothetical protein
MLIFGICQPNAAEKFCYKKAEQLNRDREYSVSQKSLHWRRTSMTVCGLVVRDPGCITEMYCASCEVWTEFIYVM